MEKDNNFINWYKKSIEAFRPTPPADSWTEINRVLDLDEVWENIHADLDNIDRNDRFYNYTKYAESTILIAIILTFLNFHDFMGRLNNIIGKENTISYAKEDSMEQRLASRDTSLIERQRNRSKRFQNNRSASNKRKFRQQTNNSKKTISQGVAKQFADKVNSRKRIQEKLPYDLRTALFSKPDNNNGTVLNLALAPLITYGFDFENPDEVPPKRDVTALKAIKGQYASNDKPEEAAFLSPLGFSIGIHGAFKNHWLLNSATYTGLSSEEINTTLPSFGKNLGIMAGMDLNSRIAIQNELAYSEEGQNYKDYINGKYAKKRIALQYYSVSAIIKYRLHPLRGLSTVSSSNILLGLYVSHLNKAEEQVENQNKDVLGAYKTFDTGLLAGYEHEYFVSKSLIIATGIRVKYGFTNIYSGDGRVPSTLNATKIGSVDLNLTIKYLFPEK